jgi:hypothetical protein
VYQLHKNVSILDKIIETVGLLWSQKYIYLCSLLFIQSCLIVHPKQSFFTSIISMFFHHLCICICLTSICYNIVCFSWICVILFATTTQV